MRVLVFNARCVHHGHYETIKVKGSDTHRNIDKGYDRVAHRMKELGCDDYDTTYSVTRDDSLRPTLRAHPERETS